MPCDRRQLFRKLALAGSASCVAVTAVRRSTAAMPAAAPRVLPHCTDNTCTIRSLRATDDGRAVFCIVVMAHRRLASGSPLRSSGANESERSSSLRSHTSCPAR